MFFGLKQSLTIRQSLQKHPNHYWLKLDNEYVSVLFTESLALELNMFFLNLRIKTAADMRYCISTSISFLENRQPSDDLKKIVQ